MKRRPPGAPKAPVKLRLAGAEAQPALPAWKAFAVQFSRDTSGAGGTFAGRIEHLNSGRRARFSSRKELLAVIERMLAEIEGPTT